MVKGQTHHRQLETILDRAINGQTPGSEEILFLLTLKDRESLAGLFTAARSVRQRHFGNKIFLYGFLYFSTECCNDCLFCQYRTSNRSLKRYRKDASEIIEAAQQMAESGVHLIDLTMGESADFQRENTIESRRLISLVRSINRASGLPVMISPGVISARLLDDTAAAGASWYACYQETYNRSLFARMRIGQSFDQRTMAKEMARIRGMSIEEGMLIGIGESVDDIAETILAMRDMDADQIRVMTFVPQAGTPMGHHPPPDELAELIVIAVMRLTMPDRLIPASLDVGGLDGLQKRLESGANVITSLVVPGQGLAGVANQSLDIEQARRTVQATLPILGECGLEPATAEEYRRWIAGRKNPQRAAWRNPSSGYRFAGKVA